MAVRVTIAAVGGALSFLYVLWITSKLKAGRAWMRWLFTLFEIGSFVVVASVLGLLQAATRQLVRR